MKDHGSYHLGQAITVINETLSTPGRANGIFARWDYHLIGVKDRYRLALKDFAEDVHGALSDAAELEKIKARFETWLRKEFPHERY